ncbi:MAG TPA: hypothetical protein VGB78_09085 [Thermoplasmata archaeon]|jgi:hypothetical protein
MDYSTDPGLLRDFTEAKAGVIMHGIVILRAVEMDLEPAIMTAAKGSMASSPRKMSQMEDDELDRFSNDLRKNAIKACLELKKLYTRLLTRIGTESVEDIVGELEGIRALVTWDRISKAAEPVNKLLAENGFRSLELEGPEAVSEGFQIELMQKWPEALDRFAALATKVAHELRNQEDELPESRRGKGRGTSGKG